MSYDKLRIYRIVHISNVDFILKNGMFTKGHKSADPNYYNIGDSVLIKQRATYLVKVDPPNGTLGEYIPFYFGPLSPMLLNIHTGYRGIKKIHQSKIIYFVCKLSHVFATCKDWCFTDGHAKNNITDFYNRIEDLDKIDWDVVFSKYWNPTEDDFDRMRKKQAEFLIKNHVPVETISDIVVYDKNAKDEIEKLIAEHQLKIKVYINPKGKFYY